MKKKIAPIELDCKHLIRITASLPKHGQVKICDNGYSYLDIDDNYIHQIYPLIKQDFIIKADYFKNNIGAHITITYPEEKTLLSSKELFKNILFEVRGFSSFVISTKKYFILLVNSPELLDLRRKYGLAEHLKFKNHLIALHITIATQQLS